MVSDGRRHHRCQNPREPGHIFCREHGPNDDSKAVAVWTPPARVEQAIVLAPVHNQCWAHTGVRGHLTRCHNRPTPSSRAGRYCSTHAYLYRLPSEEECAVCMEPNDETKDVPLSCGHLFHATCLDRWLQTNAHPQCPKCRVPLTEAERQRYHVPEPGPTLLESLRGVLGGYARILTEMGQELRRMSREEPGDNALDVTALLANSMDLDLLINMMGRLSMQRIQDEIRGMIQSHAGLAGLLASQLNGLFGAAGR